MTTRKDRLMNDKRPDLEALVESVELRHRATTEAREIEWQGYKLRVLPGVFDPEYSNIGDLLSQHMRVPPGARVLDLGTGSGIQALVAARQASSVVAIDLQADAAGCARENVERLGLAHKVEVRQGDLFEPLHEAELFDAIVFNFPFVPWEPQTAWQRANFDPGHRLLRRFFAEVGDHLAPGGEITMTWSDIGDTELFLALARENGLECATRVERSSANVNHYIFVLRLVDDAAPSAATSTEAESC